MTNYIDKSALVAKIEDWRDKIRKGIFSIPLTGSDRAFATFEYEILGKIKDFLDTLEVKEVDLEKEIDSIEDRFHGFESLSRNDVIDIARHFANWQKEQMMKDAVDAEIYREIENDDTREYSLHAISHKLDKSKYKFMEKVKVIIIK